VNRHPAGTVFFVVPDCIDDAERVSGGNVYDRRVRDGLRSDGWDVRMVLVADGGDNATTALGQLPGGALVLVDGLLVTHHANALVAEASRLRLVVLAHMVASDLADPERSVYGLARRVITTSNWTRTELIAQDAADPRRIIVAHPGTDPAPATMGSAAGGRLLFVGAVAPHKGLDLLTAALAGCADIASWTCTIVGSLRTEPDFVAALRAGISSAGLSSRMAFTGVLTGRALEDAWARTDLLIMPSRSESYGMVVAEALARGIPVLTSGIGGIPEAISHDAAAMVVPPEDPWALEVVLRQWWASPTRREELRVAASKARNAARQWSTTTAVVASALTQAGTASARTPDVLPWGVHAGSAPS